MKFLRVFLSLLAAGVMFASCQKELSLEAGTATGTLKFDGTGDCLPILINGTYQKDTLLNASNYIDVQIDVVETGNYNILTDTVNGYSFSAIGQVAESGVQTIRLQGTGRPIAPSVDVFTVRFSGTTCQVNIIVTGTGGGGGGTSAFTLGGSPGACSGAVLSGTYTAGTAMTPSNTATLNVNVTAIGTYSLISPTVNGVTFSGTGTFTTTGPSTLVLTASGTPTTATTSNYTVTSGTSSCTFSVIYSSGATGYTLNCTAPVLAGTYTADVPMTASNTMTISVNVASAGPYNITSTCVNGVTFAGTGTLTATPATQNVTLTATGTPAVAGTFTYPLTGGTSTCNVPVTFAASTATDFIKATIDGVAFTFNDAPDAIYDVTTVPGFNILDIFGASTTCGAPTMELVIATPTPGVIPPGTYHVNATTYVVFGDYIDAIGDDYYDQTDGTTHPAPVLTIVVTSSTATRIAGTFSGLIKLDGVGPGTRTITAGSFSVPVH